MKMHSLRQRTGADRDDSFGGWRTTIVLLLLCITVLLWLLPPV